MGTNGEEEHKLPHAHAGQFPPLRHLRSWVEVSFVFVVFTSYCNRQEDGRIKHFSLRLFLYSSSRSLL